MHDGSSDADNEDDDDDDNDEDGTKNGDFLMREAN